MSKVRWGFVSTATIGHKNWQAVKLSGNGVVSGVASRDKQAAGQFIDDCQSWCPYERPATAFGSYRELIESDTVDAIYLPLPTGLRKEWVIAAASAGKHVLCEKPCAASHEDLTEMVEACRANGVQFMDGVMFMHTGRLKRLRATVEDGSSIGQLKRIACQFSFCADEEWLQTNIRVDSNLEPQGCVGDLGWYCIRFILFHMDWKLPERIHASVLTERQRPGSPRPVPLEFSAELFFENGVSAAFYCSFITHHQQWANLSGNRGYVHVNDFVLPYKGDTATFEVSNADFVMNQCDFEMLDHRRTVTTSEAGNSAANSQESNLFRVFNELVLNGTPDQRWAEYSLKTQQVMDACLETARERSAVSSG
jgi:predicted dehydrogenase